MISAIFVTSCAIISMFSLSGRPRSAYTFPEPFSIVISCRLVVCVLFIVPTPWPFVLLPSIFLELSPIPFWALQHPAWIFSGIHAEQTRSQQNEAYRPHCMCSLPNLRQFPAHLPSQSLSLVWPGHASCRSEPNIGRSRRRA